MAEQNLTQLYGQTGWKLENKNLSIFVTETGGHLAPACFYKDSSAPVQPYFISPWHEENSEISAGVLKVLRGDFFCAPFGGNAAEYGGVKYPPHGESASNVWTCLEVNAATLKLKQDSTVQKGASITKTLSIKENHNVIYISHELSGFSGKMPLGHHPILTMPDKDGGMILSSSSFEFGMTHPEAFSSPKDSAYQILAYGEKFSDLHKVPLLLKNQESRDYTVYPSPYGYTDLIALLKKKSDNPAWMTAVYPESGYLWFALKDASVLPATMLWISNSGRFKFPWNGRTRCIGIEDVCSYFAYGIKDSTENNSFNEAGFKTAIELDSSKTTEIRHIQGVMKIPAGFGEVISASFNDGELAFTDKNGLKAAAAVDWTFIQAKV